VKWLLNYGLLLGVQNVSRSFYRFETAWVGEPHPDPWARDLRLVAILNHTSLYEPLFAGAVPARFLRRIARDGLVPVAEKTLRRPLVGSFFRLVAPNVVSVTRLRDHTWTVFQKSIRPWSLVVMLPEGRMKRSTGLDSEGQPMTVRGGIADVLLAIDRGRMLLAYSGGLHHVQAPGEKLPRAFQTLRMNFETIDIKRYCAELGAGGDAGAFKIAVVRDLERRRDLHCPRTAETDPGAAR
jgi:hypothetical protein